MLIFLCQRVIIRMLGVISITYAELLKGYIKRSRLTLDEIVVKLRAKGLSASREHLSRLQNGKVAPASEDLNRAIAEITNGDPEKLIYYAYLDKLPEHIRGVFIKRSGDDGEKKGDLPLVAEAMTPYVPETMARVPVLGTIRAGEPIDRVEVVDGYELVETELLRGRNGFVLRVRGDSMIGDRIFEGDRVVVVAQEVVNSTDIAVVAVNGYEATLKRVKYQDGMAILSSSNPAMETMIYPAKDVFVLGKVIEVRHSLE